MLKQFFRPALLVGAGSAITLLAQMGLPTLGLSLYGSAFRSAYADCQMAKVHSAALNKLQLDTALHERLRKTEEVDELRCLDYQGLRYRLQQFKVTSVDLDAIATAVVKQTADLRR